MSFHKFPASILKGSSHRQNTTQCVKENNGITKIFLKDLIKESSLQNATVVSNKNTENKEINVQKNEKNESFNVTYTWETDSISIYCRDKQLFAKKRSVLFHMVTFNHGLKSSIVEELKVCPTILSKKSSDERLEFINNFNAEKSTQGGVENGTEILAGKQIEKESERENEKECCNNYELIKLEIEFVATLNLLTFEELEVLFYFFFPEKMFSFNEYKDKENIIEHFLQSISSVSMKYSSIIKSGMSYNEHTLNKHAKFTTLKEYLKKLKDSEEEINNSTYDPKIEENPVTSYERSNKNKESEERNIHLDDEEKIGSGGEDNPGTTIKAVAKNTGNDEHEVSEERGIESMMHKISNVVSQVTENMKYNQIESTEKKLIGEETSALRKSGVKGGKKRARKKQLGLDPDAEILNPKNHIMINIKDFDIFKHNDNIFINLNALREMKIDTEVKKKSDTFLTCIDSETVIHPSNISSTKTDTTKTDSTKADTTKTDTTKTDTTKADSTKADTTKTDTTKTDTLHVDVNVKNTDDSDKKLLLDGIKDTQTNIIPTGEGKDNNMSTPLRMNKAIKRFIKKNDINKKRITKVCKNAQEGEENCMIGISQLRKKKKICDMHTDNNSIQIILPSPNVAEQVVVREHLCRGHIVTEKYNSEIFLSESKIIKGYEYKDAVKSDNKNRNSGNSPKNRSSIISGTPIGVGGTEKEIRYNDELDNARNVETDEDTHEIKDDTIHSLQVGSGNPYTKNNDSFDHEGSIQVIPLGERDSKLVTSEIIDHKNVKKKKKNIMEKNKPQIQMGVNLTISEKTNISIHHNEINKNKKTPMNKIIKKRGLNNSRKEGKTKCSSVLSVRKNRNVKSNKCVCHRMGNEAICNYVHKHSIKRKAFNKKKECGKNSNHKGDSYFVEKKSNVFLKKQLNNNISVGEKSENRRNFSKIENKQLCDLSTDNIIQHNVMNLTYTRSCRLHRYIRG
ncbi:hypothetical protein, conserved [Plasmodium gonderi]|uniref:Uncharacterized protein n=1 Tax=Plasmodium gonderi TaxID=77519 RepID=A0A1Y1JM68_PLAGO|nr:hypothetical protein, conserved [Plasmodium gonderi]GAW83686.1 hypothetical protein, conserved [Plasmodium gonderi]